jgi:hypothetical protein
MPIFQVTPRFCRSTRGYIVKHEAKGDGFDMNKDERLREARWLIVKAMLDEYPDLRESVKKYLMKDSNAP